MKLGSSSVLQLTVTQLKQRPYLKTLHFYPLVIQILAVYINANESIRFNVFALAIEHSLKPTHLHGTTRT